MSIRGCNTGSVTRQHSGLWGTPSGRKSTPLSARIDDLLVLNARLNKTDFDKYLRNREAMLPSDLGGLGTASPTTAPPSRLRSTVPGRTRNSP